MHVRDMLRAHPRPLDVDLEVLARTIESLDDCATTCGLCAAACLAEKDVEPLATCVRRDLDCAALCRATAGLLSGAAGYDNDVVRPALEACMAACRGCADECDGHAEHMEHCRVCAEACRACEQACSDLLAAMV